MRIGFVSFWFNRGQAFVTKAIRGVMREAGHETCVLARPDRTQGRVRTDDVWAEPDVEVASGNDISRDEYLGWAARRKLDVVFLFQNEQYEAAKALRDAGVVTVGTFMWEKLRPEDAPAVLAGYDLVYAMNACDADRYARMGILCPRVHWGCWPELDGLDVPDRAPGAPVVFHYPAGYLETRRAVLPTVKSFLQAAVPGARLLVKSAKPIPSKDRIEHASITWNGEDLTRSEHLELCCATDVLLCNTRWEGLGLSIFEAVAMGHPVIAPDFPPMSEYVRHGLTGRLVPLKRWGRGTAPSGIPAADVRAGALVDSIRALGDRSVVQAMRPHVRAFRDTDCDWRRTRADLQSVLAAAVRRKVR